MMKYYALINSDDGFIVEKVDGKTCKSCNSAFTWKDDNDVYHLTDKESGLSICRCKKLKDLEDHFNKYYKRRYDEFRKTDAYKIKVERFEKMKLVNNYSKGVK